MSQGHFNPAISPAHSLRPSRPNGSDHNRQNISSNSITNQTRLLSLAQLLVRDSHMIKRDFRALAADVVAWGACPIEQAGALVAIAENNRTRLDHDLTKQDT